MKQYILFASFFSFFICFFINISSAATCYDNPYNDVTKLVKVDCETEKDVVKRAPPPPDQSMFQFTVDCRSSNETCNKVINEFEIAGQEIAKIIKLNTQ